MREPISNHCSQCMGGRRNDIDILHSREAIYRLPPCFRYLLEAVVFHEGFHW
jgi:hypothetical protein